MEIKTAKNIISECKCLNIRDVRLLIMSVKSNSLESLTYENIVFHPEKISLNSNEMSLFYGLLQRYKNNEPLSKIINKRSFWAHDFFINNDVLDPRSETELIVESVLIHFDKVKSIDFLDIGTGSGCILLSLLSEFRNSKGLGIDISKSAIQVAEYNKKNLSIKNANFLSIDWNDLHEKYTEKFDVIVSNPPYIKSCDICKLDENVRKYDPFIALNGGNDGLNAYMEIAEVAKKIIKNDGMIFLEVGYDQSKDVMNILKSNGFTDMFCVKDYNGIDRVVIAKLH